MPTFTLLPQAQRQGNTTSGHIQLPATLPGDGTVKLEALTTTPNGDLQDPTKSFLMKLFVSPDNIQPYTDTGRVFGFRGASYLTRLPSIVWDLTPFAGEFIEVTLDIPVSMQLGFTATF